MNIFNKVSSCSTQQFVCTQGVFIIITSYAQGSLSNDLVWSVIT